MVSKAFEKPRVSQTRGGERRQPRRRERQTFIWQIFCQQKSIPVGCVPPSYPRYPTPGYPTPDAPWMPYPWYPVPLDTLPQYPTPRYPIPGRNIRSGTWYQRYNVKPRTEWNVRENITFPQLRWWAVKSAWKWKISGPRDADVNFI